MERTKASSDDLGGASRIVGYEGFFIGLEAVQLFGAAAVTRAVIVVLG